MEGEEENKDRRGEEDSPAEDIWPGPLVFWILTLVLSAVILAEIYLIQDRYRATVNLKLFQEGEFTPQVKC